MANFRKKVVAPVAAPSVPNESKIQPPLLKRGLRVTEVSAYTGATVSAVRLAIKSKELPARLIGKRHVILREDADAWLNSRRAA